MHPRLGSTGLAVASPFAFLLIFNTWLGAIPAIMVRTPSGGWEKYHPVTKLLSLFGLGGGKSYWSEAGVMTAQDHVQLLLMLIGLGCAWYGLRKRPEISGPAARDLAAEREAMEAGGGFELSVLPDGMGGGIGSPFTAAIIAGVMGEDQELDETEVSSALGQLGSMAEANAAAEAAAESSRAERQDAGPRDDLPNIASVEFDDVEVPGMDGTGSDAVPHGITSIGLSRRAAEELEVESNDDGISDPSSNLPPLPGDSSEFGATSKTPSSTESGRGLEEMVDEMFEDSKEELKTELPPVPGMPSREFNIAESVPVVEPSTPTRLAAPPTTSGRVVRSDGSPPSESSSDVGEIDDEGDSDGSTTVSGSMPIRPHELPASAEYDPRTGRWLLHGAPLGDTLAPLDE